MESPTQRQSDINIILDFAHRDALSMAVEDSTGPWELLWDLFQQFPDSDQSFLKLIAQLSLIELAYTDQICIVRWNPESNIEEELTPAGLISALWLPETWNADVSGLTPHLRFYATSAGRDIYSSRAVRA